MWETFRKIRDLLEPRDRSRVFLLLGLILVTAGMETAGVASIMPFVAVLANPSAVQTNPYLSAAHSWLGFDTIQDFLFFLGLVVLVAVTSSAALMVLTNWAILRFISMRSCTLSSRLFAGYLHRPYAWFPRRHTADLGRTVLSEVDQVVGGALVPAMQLITQAVTVLLLIAMLVVIDAFLASTIVAVLGGAYWLISGVVRRQLKRMGEDRVRANHERFRLSSEGLGGIKDVKSLGLEEVFLRQFEKSSRLFHRAVISSQMIAQLPQHVLRTIAFMGILLILQYQLLLRGDLGDALPLITLYVLAGSRLLQALNGVYQNGSKLRFAKPALDVLHRDLAERVVALQSSEEPSSARMKEFCLTNQLELRHVSYCYPGASNLALHDVSLTIPGKASVGFVGRTGAGKTTLADVILGLLDVDDGQLLVNGTLITAANKRDWQRCVGYVPQHIFLTDDSVVANIAFGIPPSEIDGAAVERAARVANLHDFVTRELECGYDTLIGERGVRLSGGQRQRVGIARALYRDPTLLIMDEATNALDNITERAVLDAVANLAGQKTIILVAHRLTTVRRCDIIFLLEHGRIVARGTYDALVDNSVRFRELVNSGVQAKP